MRSFFCENALLLLQSIRLFNIISKYEKNINITFSNKSHRILTRTITDNVLNSIKTIAHIINRTYVVLCIVITYIIIQLFLPLALLQ